MLNVIRLTKSQISIFGLLCVSIKFVIVIIPLVKLQYLIPKVITLSTFHCITYVIKCPSMTSLKQNKKNNSNNIQNLRTNNNICFASCLCLEIDINWRRNSADIITWFVFTFGDSSSHKSDFKMKIALVICLGLLVTLSQAVPKKDEASVSFLGFL